MHLKPITRALRGAPINTVNSRQQQLFFMDALLSTKGDSLRSAKIVLSEIQEKISKKSENTGNDIPENDKELQEQEKEVVIAVAIASLQQQYRLAGDDREEQVVVDALNENDYASAYHNAFLEYFTEADLRIIQFAIETGKVWSREELFEYASKKVDLLPKSVGE